MKPQCESKNVNFSYYGKKKKNLKILPPAPLFRFFWAIFEIEKMPHTSLNPHQNVHNFVLSKNIQLVFIYLLAPMSTKQNSESMFCIKLEKFCSADFTPRQEIWTSHQDMISFPLSNHHKKYIYRTTKLFALSWCDWLLCIIICSKIISGKVKNAPLHVCGQWGCGLT